MILFFLFSYLMQFSPAQVKPQSPLDSRLDKILKLRDIRAHGPNCYNSVLVASGLSDHLRYSSPRELHFVLSSPSFCRERGQKEKTIRGDIQVYKKVLDGLNGPDRFTHANIWIDKNLVFNKMTQYATSDYLLTGSQWVDAYYKTFTDIFVFNVLDENGLLKTVRCPPQSTCYNEVIVYSCRGSLKRTMEQIGEADFKKFFRDLQKLENHMESQILSSEGLTAESKETLRVELMELEAALVSLSSFSAELQWWRSYFKLALESIRTQLEYTQPLHPL